MHSTEIKEFIQKHRELFWYIPEDKKSEISPEVLVETILNYGDMESIKQLISLLGMNEVANLFFSSINLSDRRKGNYHELTINYFTLFFQRHVS